jgi:hypothetical protein
MPVDSTRQARDADFMYTQVGLRCKDVAAYWVGLMKRSTNSAWSYEGG